MREALGLSDSLIGDLGEWGGAMNHLDGNPTLQTEKAYADLDQRARRLLARLEDEVGSRFTITYQPW